METGMYTLSIDINDLLLAAADANATNDAAVSAAFNESKYQLCIHYSG